MQSNIYTFRDFLLKIRIRIKKNEGVVVALSFVLGKVVCRVCRVDKLA